MNDWLTPDGESADMKNQVETKYCENETCKLIIYINEWNQVNAHLPTRNNVMNTNLCDYWVGFSEIEKFKTKKISEHKINIQNPSDREEQQR